MNNQENNCFFVGLTKEKGRLVSHTIGFDESFLLETKAEKKSSENSNVILPDSKLDFKNAFQTFISVMESYRKFIPLTLHFSNILSTVVAERSIGSFVKDKGVERKDLSTKSTKVYEIPIDRLREYNTNTDEVMAAVSGANHLPEVMIIGLVSAYDAFLSRLLRVIFN